MAGAAVFVVCVWHVVLSAARPPSWYGARALCWFGDCFDGLWSCNALLNVGCVYTISVNVLLLKASKSLMRGVDGLVHREPEVNHRVGFLVAHI
jgi:hypothetical protein